MSRILFVLSFFVLFSWSHPVSYTIDLNVSYNENNKKVKVICVSNSKNKCGLYSYHLLDKSDNIIKTKRYPFFKKESNISSEIRPYKMVFFLRKTPEHNYIKIFD